jgi:hypothetical protein
VEINSGQALSYFKLRGAGLTLDSRVLSETCDLLLMKHHGTNVMEDRRSEVAKNATWDKETSTTQFLSAGPNQFLSLDEANIAHAKLFAQSFTEGPFILDGGTCARPLLPAIAPRPQLLLLLRHTSPDSLHPCSPCRLVLPRLKERDGLDSLPFLKPVPAERIKWVLGEDEFEIEASSQAMAIIATTYEQLKEIVKEYIKQIPAVAELRATNAQQAKEKGSTSKVALGGGSRKRGGGHTFVLPDSELAVRMAKVGSSAPCVRNALL